MKPTNTGVALLLVLAAVMVLSATTLSFYRFSVSHHLVANADRDAEMAADLVQVADAPILEWLLRESEEIVLPSDQSVARVEVLREQGQLAGRPFAMKIVAYDQEGMVSLEAAKHGSPLRAHLPENVRLAIDETEWDKQTILGLDLFEARSNGVGTTSPYPVSESEPRDASTKALGAFVATHNAAPGSLNVHTAPWTLLEAVFRGQGRGGLDLILEARHQGVPSTLLPPKADSSKEDPFPHLALQSTTWAFRTDVRVGAVRQSYWSVFRFQGEAGWARVQRLQVDD